MPAVAWWPVRCPGEPYLEYAVLTALVISFLLLPFALKYIFLSFRDTSPENFLRLYLKTNGLLYMPTVASAFFFSRGLYLAFRKSGYAGLVPDVAGLAVCLLALAAVEAWIYNRRKKPDMRSVVAVSAASVIGWAFALTIMFTLALTYPGPSTYGGNCWLPFKASKP